MGGWRQEAGEILHHRQITHLHHQTDNKHHCDTADDIGMILDDELMAQNRWILFILFATKRLRTECI